MLLDLDQGSMRIWKNDEKMGVMVAEGLSGPLCWAVSQYYLDSGRIDSAPAPGSPTEEELAAAKAWEEGRQSSHCNFVFGPISAAFPSNKTVPVHKL